MNILNVSAILHMIFDFKLQLLNIIYKNNHNIIKQQLMNVSHT